jgi:hypothetical protein
MVIFERVMVLWEKRSVNILNFVQHFYFCDSTEFVKKKSIDGFGSKY